MHVVVATRIHVDVLGDYDGALTANLTGTIRLPDADKDGVPNRTDNCRLVANADQSPVPSPVVRAPGDVTLHSCADTRIGQPTAVDVCESGPLIVSSDAPHPYPLGTTIVTWSAEDSHGHLGTGEQTVTIDDTTTPVFTSVPTGVTLLDCGPADLGLPTASDDCGGSPTFANDAPGTFLVGTTVVTWTATDLSGNHSTTTQLVTVTDTVLPAVSCVPGSNPSGHGNGGGGFFQVFAADHCDVPVIRLGGFVLGIGETVKITETGQPGFRLVGVMGPERIRHFQVGRGDSVITATDGSGNVASAACR
jgi:hypothetical protein